MPQKKNISWRDEMVARLEALCALVPPPPGFKIDTRPLPYWRNRTAEKPRYRVKAGREVVA